MRRISPRGGYDAYGPKRNYRREIWGYFRRHTISPASTRALLIEDQGAEIREALMRGYRAENLFVVNRSAAVLANLSRRYPGINTYAGDVVDAVQRMRRDRVRLGIANFDLTNSLGEPLLNTVGELSREAPLDPRICLFAITMKRGREHPRMFRRIKDLVARGNDRLVFREFPIPANDRARLALVWGAFVHGGPDMLTERLWHHVWPRRVGLYKTTSPMMWAIFVAEQRPRDAWEPEEWDPRTR